MHSNQRHELRDQYRQIWEKYQQKAILTDLEMQIAKVIAEHPEYHFLFNDKEKFLDHDFFSDAGEQNPYLHMGLHLSLRDQLNTKLPVGINWIFEQLCTKTQNAHAAEHVMMEVLSFEIFDAIQNQRDMLNETRYMRELRKRIESL